MSDENTSSAKPPYLSYTTFRNFINGMKKGVVPTRIDKTMMPGQSGSTQSYLISALKFFKLVDGVGAPSNDLHTMVEGTDVERLTTWKRVFTEAYAPVIDGLNLERASTGELHERFMKMELNGETARKCHSFFAAGAEAAGIALAPHLKANARSTSGPRKSRKARSNGVGTKDAIATVAPLTTAPPKTMAEMLLAKFPELDPKWDKDIQEKWFDSFKTLMASAGGHGEKTPG